MKKIIALALALMSLVTFAACNDRNQETEGESTTEVTQAPFEYVLAVDTTTKGVVKENVPINEKKVTIGNKEYEFPVAISELIDDGWYFDENMQERMQLVGGTVAADSVENLSDMNLYHDEYGARLMLLMVSNDTNEEQLLRDCTLDKFGINVSMMNDPSEVNIVLPGGITLQSTAADVVEIYGESENNPYFMNVKHDGSSAEYFGELYAVNFTFFEDGTIEYICFF